MNLPCLLCVDFVFYMIVPLGLDLMYKVQQQKIKGKNPNKCKAII